MNKEEFGDVICPNCNGMNVDVDLSKSEVDYFSYKCLDCKTTGDSEMGVHK